MQVALVTGDVSKCYLVACASFVRMGITGDENAVAQATVQAAYNLEDFKVISILLREMKELKVEPEVYVWDEKAQAPEVAILFKVQKPRRQLLDMLAVATSPHPDARNVFKKISDYVLATAEANISQSGVSNFLKAYGHRGRCTIIVREDDEPPDATKIDYATAIVLESTLVKRQMPKLE